MDEVTEKRNEQKKNRLRRRDCHQTHPSDESHSPSSRRTCPRPQCIHPSIHLSSAVILSAAWSSSGAQSLHVASAVFPHSCAHEPNETPQRTRPFFHVFFHSIFFFFILLTVQPHPRNTLTPCNLQLRVSAWGFALYLHTKDVLGQIPPKVFFLF